MFSNKVIFINEKIKKGLRNLKKFKITKHNTFLICSNDQ